MMTMQKAVEDDTMTMQEAVDDTIFQVVSGVLGNWPNGETYYGDVEDLIEIPSLDTLLSFAKKYIDKHLPTDEHFSLLGDPPEGTTEADVIAQAQHLTPEELRALVLSNLERIATNADGTWPEENEFGFTERAAMGLTGKSPWPVVSGQELMWKEGRAADAQFFYARFKKGESWRMSFASAGERWVRDGRVDVDVFPASAPELVALGWERVWIRE
jgi:hypothetical protein